MKILFLFISFYLFVPFSRAQIYEIDTLFFSGRSDKFINIVIVPDGYQEAELGKFAVDAGNFAAGLFAVSPFDRYKSYFNIFTINVPSNESGANHPGTATDVSEPAHPVQVVDNVFGSTFDYFSIHRLLVPLKSDVIYNVLGENFPAFDQVIVLVNSEFYGGSGGALATASTHVQSIEVCIHELGHSFAGLADEYYAGDSYAREAINMTAETDPVKVKWKNWLGTNETGIYQHCCGGNSASWYRPHENCKMRYLGPPFCPVCQEGIIERIHSLISPIDAFSPENTFMDNDDLPVDFELTLIKPLPNTLKNTWDLNGELLSDTGDTLSLDATDLIAGTNYLTVYIQDTSELLRVNAHDQIHLYSVLWTIENEVLGSDRIKGELNVIDINIYPNPTSGILNVNIDKVPDRYFNIRMDVVDASGKVARSSSFENKELMELDLHDLSAGSYFVKIYFGNVHLATKAVVIE